MEAEGRRGKEREGEGSRGKEREGEGRREEGKERIKKRWGEGEKKGEMEGRIWKVEKEKKGRRTLTNILTHQSILLFPHILVCL